MRRSAAKRRRASGEPRSSLDSSLGMTLSLSKGHARASRMTGTGSSCRRGALLLLFGQNHPINVTASGMIATGSAHGVKIEPTKKAEVTTAHKNGQIDGS